MFHIVGLTGLHFCMLRNLTWVARIRVISGFTNGFSNAAPKVSPLPNEMGTIGLNFRVCCLILEMISFLVKG